MPPISKRKRFIEKTDREMLYRIEKVAESVAKYLHNEEKAYSTNNFQNVNNKTYQSPLIFALFDEPAIDPDTNRYFLVAIQSILEQVEEIMHLMPSNAIQNISPRVVNVSRTLKKFIPQLVPHPNSNDWEPTKMTFQQLEKVADDHQSEWPTPKSDKADTRDLLINLTLIQQLATTMTNLRNSARALTPEI
jgi:hypothetical protein